MLGVISYAAQELETAKQSIATLESELKTERSKLRSLFTEQDRFERERENVLAKLRRTESVRNVCPFGAETMRFTLAGHRIWTT
jgi:chromosome segregation ATPase